MNENRSITSPTASKEELVKSAEHLALYNEDANVFPDMMGGHYG